MKLITLELPDWANWVTQDFDSEIFAFDLEPKECGQYFNAENNEDRMQFVLHTDRLIPDWRDSKINLNAHGAYIDANGILRRCELIPDMLKPQAD